MTDIQNLLDIPAFLKRGTPEHDHALALGAAILAAKPRLPKKPSRSPAANTGYRKTKDKHNCAESTVYILKSLGWTDKVINRLSAKAANQYADGGVKMQAIHEIEK